MIVSPSVDLIRRKLVPTELTSLIRDASQGPDELNLVRAVCPSSDAASMLGEALAYVCSVLDGTDWFEDDEFAQDCVEAGIDPEVLARVHGGLTPSQLADRKRKQTGDLGEILAVADQLGYRSSNPAETFPKNIRKLYIQISEPGVDVLVLSLDLQSRDTEFLAERDHLTLVEAKGSATHESHAALAALAANSLSQLNNARLQRELLMLQELYAHSGHNAAAKRLRYFLLAFAERTDNVSYCAYLLSEAKLPADLACPELVVLGSPERPVSVTACEAPVAGLEQSAFSHRYADD